MEYGTERQPRGTDFFCGNVHTLGIMQALGQGHQSKVYLSSVLCPLWSLFSDMARDYWPFSRSVFHAVLISKPIDSAIPAQIVYTRYGFSLYLIPTHGFPAAAAN